VSDLHPMRINLEKYAKDIGTVCLPKDLTEMFMRTSLENEELRVKLYIAIEALKFIKGHESNWGCDGIATILVARAEEALAELEKP